MPRILPLSSEDIDLSELVAGEERPPPPGRPWVVLNMITSVDGAVIAGDGRSGPLSGPPDRALFRILRAQADVVLAGANTVRVEDYGPAGLPPELEARRQADGRPARPRLAVVSASLRLDPAARFFRQGAADQPPLVLTTRSALASHPAAAAALEPVATVVEAGANMVDWTQALAHLATHQSTNVLLVEGGPTINGQLLVADLVDELCLTVSPVLVGGMGPGLSAGPHLEQARNLQLTRVIEEESFLMLRYVRAQVTDT